jgi:hypothetical protein
MNAPTLSTRPSRLAHPLLWGLVWLVVYFVARGLLDGSTLSTWQRVAIALAPIPVAAATLWGFVRGAKELDELQLRIQLEALATAFLLSVLFLMTLGLLQRAITLKFEDWSYAHVWAMLPTLYFIGLAVAKRRYE